MGFFFSIFKFVPEETSTSMSICDCSIHCAVQSFCPQPNSLTCIDYFLSIFLSTLLFLPVFCMLLKLTNWKLRFFSSQYDNRWTWIEPGISDESWEQWTLTNCSFIAIASALRERESIILFMLWKKNNNKLCDIENV